MRSSPKTPECNFATRDFIGYKVKGRHSFSFLFALIIHSLKNMLAMASDPNQQVKLVKMPDTYFYNCLSITLKKILKIWKDFILEKL